MLISLLICVLSLYCLFVVFDIIIFTVNQHIKKIRINILAVPRSTHYLCSSLTLIITIALLLNIIDFDSSLMWFYIVFGSAVIVSIPLILWIVFWKIEWLDEKIYFRNLFGLRQTYDVKKIHLMSKKQFTIIMYQNRKITDYNFMLLNISNVKKFEIFVKQYSEHDSFT